MVVHLGDRNAVASNMAIHVGSLAVVASDVSGKSKCNYENLIVFFWTLTMVFQCMFMNKANAKLLWYLKNRRTLYSNIVFVTSQNKIKPSTKKDLL